VLGWGPLPLNIAEGNGKQNLKDWNRLFEIARGSALDTVSEGSIEYEKKHEQSIGPKCSIGAL
jgi:hypothetical protein